MVGDSWFVGFCVVIGCCIVLSAVAWGWVGGPALVWFRVWFGVCVFANLFWDAGGFAFWVVCV